MSITAVARPAGALTAAPSPPTAPQATVDPPWTPIATSDPPLPVPVTPPPPPVTPHAGLPFLVGASPYAIAPQPLDLGDPLVTTGVLPAARLPVDSDSGGGGGTVNRHVFEQVTPAAIWTVSHGLNDYPAVTVIDSGGTLVDFFALTYVDANTLSLTFGGAFAGKAYYL